MNCLDPILDCSWRARVEVEAALKNAIIILLEISNEIILSIVCHSKFLTCPSEQSSSKARLKLLRTLPLVVTHLVLAGRSRSQVRAS